MKQLLASISLGLVAAGLSVAPAMAAPTVQTVLPSDLAVNNTAWYFYDDVSNTASATQVPGEYQFVEGPGTPPAGKGSVEFQTTGDQRWNIATMRYQNVKLSDLTNLMFDTYQPSTNPGNPQNAVYLNFDVNFGTGATGYQGRLVYVPRDNGTVQQNTWQEWNALSSGAVWNWSHFANGLSSSSTTDNNQWPDGNTTANRTWSSIVAAFPNATVSGQLLFRAGEPYPQGFTGYLDKATIGTTATGTTEYNFEPTLTPTTKEQCKDNGWVNFNTPQFKNQGQCVSYIVGHKGTPHHNFWQWLATKF